VEGRCGRGRSAPVGATRQLRKAIKTKGSFPNEDAARKLVYLVLQNATPQWTRTRNWTTALLAFKIHFGDRVPDTNN
jgi:putative transposase